jgi:predicted RNA-binding protein with PUA-like domain
MAGRYWLIKSEPGVYPYSQLESERKTAWTGVRNFEARNNLRAMAKGDLALYYHSGEGKEIVGVARIASAPSEDPTAPGEDWASVEVAPYRALASPVTLAKVKKTASLKSFPLVTRSRLSVAEISPEHFRAVLSLSGTTLPTRP